MSNLISDDYRELNHLLHETGEFGLTMPEHFKAIRHLIHQSKSETILDYGSGRFRWAERLFGPEFPTWSYDPCVALVASDPSPADLVICVDVLEHIEPDKLDNMLFHLVSKMLKCCFLEICCRPAEKVLADGRNAHILVQEPEWWLEKLGQFMRICDHKMLGLRRFVAIGVPL